MVKGFLHLVVIRPILACSTVSSFFGEFGSGTLPAPNTLLARSRSCFFQSVIWLG